MAFSQASQVVDAQMMAHWDDIYHISGHTKTPLTFTKHPDSIQLEQHTHTRNI